MKCNKCNDSLVTAGEVRLCSVCVADRTANEIPHDMGDDTALEAAVARKPGLGNRFIPESQASAAPSSPQPEKKKRKWFRKS